MPKKSECLLTKEEFCKYINFIKDRIEAEDKINDLFTEEFSDSIFMPYGKCIDKSVILSVGWNTQKTSTLQKTYNKRASQPWADNYPNCMHAEINAIQRLSRRSGEDFSKCHIFIYREGGGSKRLAKPCQACEKAIRDLGITNVHYTGLNSFIYEKYLEGEL